MKEIQSSSLVILMLAIFLIVPACAETAPATLKIVCTTSVLMDPATYIGGDRVEAISIADPTLCPHLQTDIIPSRIQLNMDFIKNARYVHGIQRQQRPKI